MDADAADEDESGEQAPCDRSSRIQGVQGTEVAAYGLKAADEHPGNSRQRGAHQERRRQHHQRGEEEPHEEQHGRTRREAEGGGIVERPEEAEEQRTDHRGGADGKLEEAVEPQRTRLPVRAAPEQPASQRKSREIRRQHGRDGVGGDPEDVFQEPRPDHLVDQAGRAGDDEERLDRAQPDFLAHRPTLLRRTRRGQEKGRDLAAPALRWLQTSPVNLELVLDPAVHEPPDEVVGRVRVGEEGVVEARRSLVEQVPHADGESGRADRRVEPVGQQHVERQLRRDRMLRIRLVARSDRR